MKKLAVIALGGNALHRINEQGNIEQQELNAEKGMENLLFLIRDGYNLIITHGNGPQIGNILMQNDAGQKMYDIPAMPLDICVADSQGLIGYMLERILRNVLRKHGLQKDVISIISQSIVSKDDSSFKKPAKRIGKIYTKTEMEALCRENKRWKFKPSSSDSKYWQRVVASPKPLNILNYSLVKDLALQGNIVITAGGGGIPVYYDENKLLRPVDAVVDKDLASALLANLVKADELYILTNVPYIFKNFRKPNQEKLEFLDYKDTLMHLQRGEFGEGSMAPKITACLNFIKDGGEKAIITEASKLKDKKYGSKITMNYQN